MILSWLKLTIDEIDILIDNIKNKDLKIVRKFSNADFHIINYKHKNYKIKGQILLFKQNFYNESEIENLILSDIYLRIERGEI